MWSFLSKNIINFLPRKPTSFCSLKFLYCMANGKRVEIVTDCLFLGSRLTADCDCSHEIGIGLLLARKAMTNLVCGKAETLPYPQRPI